MTVHEKGSLTPHEICPRCGQERLPAAWYKPGYEWLGHGKNKCEPRSENQ